MRTVTSALVLACLSTSLLALPRPSRAAVASPAPAVSPLPPTSGVPTTSPSPIDGDPDRDDVRPESADVVALRAKIRAAEGHRPAAQRAIETVTRSDGQRRVSTTRIGEDERTSTVAGRFEFGYGSFRGQRWHQNANGLTVLEQVRAGREARERRTVSLSHVTTPIVADVIADLDPKGHGTRTYVDPATSRVVRVDAISPTETTVTTNDDFRTTDGYTQPWHTHASDGVAVNDTDVRVDAVTTKGLTAAAVAIPDPRRELVTFPPGVANVALPVKLDAQHHFIVRVNVGGRGLDFILDSGASGIVMDEDVARGLGLPLLLAGSNASNAGRYTQHETIVPEMDVGSLVMKDVVVGTIPFTADDPRLSVRTVGLLGFDFIASLALRLDYAHASVTATEYGAFKPPTGKDVVPLDIRLGNQQPETDVLVDGHLGERFKLDTGGAKGVMMTDLFTRRYPGITRGFHSRGTSIRLHGAGGDFEAPTYEIPHVQIGPIDFTSFTAIVIGSDRLYASSGDDGVIGPDILQQFTVTTDYANSTIYLERR